MNGKLLCLKALIGFLVLLMGVPPWTLAQSAGAGAFRQEELDQMLAPIALYPDSLLGQILVAATYPDQVREADQWVRQHQSIQGDELNTALDATEWDLSVKALVPFPQVLAMMSDKVDWTQRLGGAFLTQQNDVMDTIQRLRARAHAQGNLKTTEQQRVVVLGDSIEIVPASPRVVYVPTYNPTLIYGSWQYPSYPPYAYNPYYPNYAYDPHYTGTDFVTAGLFGFAAGVAVGSIWNSGWGHWDWNRHNVNVNVDRTININRNDLRTRDFRTSNWHDVNRHRGSPHFGREVTGRSGSNRVSERTAVQTRTRPTAASAQDGLQQRRGNAQVLQGKNAGRPSQAKIHSTHGQMDRSGSPGKANAQVNRTRSEGKANAQVNRTRSEGKANARVIRSKSSGDTGARITRTQQSGKAPGKSFRNGGSASHASGKSHSSGGHKTMQH